MEGNETVMDEFQTLYKNILLGKDGDPSFDEKCTYVLNYVS
jgi:hypothetical protein